MTTQHDKQWYFIDDTRDGGVPLIDTQKLAALAEFMIETGYTSEVPRMLEKPQQYGDVWAAYQEVALDTESRGC